MRRACGFTLTEMIIVSALLTILAGVAIPVYTAVTERSYQRFARDQLQMLYTAERVYRFENNTYCDPDGGGAPPCGAGGWTGLRVDDPGLAATNAKIPVTFTVTDVLATTFTATASRTGVAGRNSTINETGTLTETSWP
ncbi:MAG: prepilin-type N-terminal cleavage/methylation domain-containing protein [Candidatus Omnitrophica bacterium]|nr:prepilin-type N-terminal cleavage/methylation domain-containing protein [Candidatus Omnitrophota bacterium]